MPRSAFVSVTIPIPGIAAEIRTQRDSSGLNIYLRLWRDAFAQGEVDDRGLLGPVFKLMGTELPRLAWLEYRRKCAGTREGDQAPIWVVTGRAALWPPLFGAIKKTIAELGPGSGTLVQSRPFAAVVADAKAWHVRLDRPTKTQYKREYPPEQIEWYLNNSNVGYGILTNGRLWRLVPRELKLQQRRFETYVEFELAVVLDSWINSPNLTAQSHL